MANTISAVAVNGRNFQTFTDVLVADSALIAATRASGGSINTGVDFRAHKYTVVQDDGLPTVVAEGNQKPAADAVVTVKSLNVEMWAKWRQVSDQLIATTDPAGLAQDIVNSAVPAFPIAFDAAHISAMYDGGTPTEVEFDAADPVTSLSNLLAPYDTTSYGATAAIFNRAGIRKLQYAIDTQARLQAAVPGGLAGILGIPYFVSGATGAQMGTSVPAGAILGVVGPFNASYVAINRGVSVTPYPQATVNSVGPEQNIVNFKIEAALGYSNAIDAATPDGTGFTWLVDKV